MLKRFPLLAAVLAGGLVGMAGFLNTLGFIPWFAKTVAARETGQ